MSFDTLPAILLIVAAYLVGSLSAAIITCRLMGLPDPRTQGSGNPGATNVLRVGGKQAAVFTLLGDMLKGLLPVLLARALQAPDELVGLVAAMAFLGHLYPVFFGFRGGKGVATAVGVLFGIDWVLALIAVATWLLVVLISRISSLGALSAAALTLVYAWVLLENRFLVGCIAAMCLLLIWRHRSNIRKLLDGSENRVTDPN